MTAMEEQAKFKIAVVYVGDANYHDLTIYSLASVARVHSAPLDFFFLQSEYLRQVPPELVAMMKARHHSLVVKSAPSLQATLPPSSARWISERFTPNPPRFARGSESGWSMRETRYARMPATMFQKASAIEALASAYDYVLYLDGDILAFDDLHCEQIGGFTEIAAVCLDLSTATGLDDSTFFSNCESNGVSPAFFNSGVMMINCREWLKTNANGRFMENVFLHEKSCPYFGRCAPNDQCAFNMTFGSDLQLLPIAWNVQKSALHTRVWKSALLRHYTGPVKFLPGRLRTCDRREHALVSAISQECKLSSPYKFYDLGISYQLNKFRRHNTVSQYEKAIERMIVPKLERVGLGRFD
jgi:lipopolysaccharide biosynthesis glycosyltransferase